MRTIATAAPVPDLPAIPNVRLSTEVLRRLPKAELHRHLDGCVRPQTILELAQEQGITLPASDVDGLGKLISVQNGGFGSLEEYLRGFDITLKVLQKPYAITRVMVEVCQDAATEGLRHLEVRFSPILHTAEGTSLSQIMEAVIEGAVIAEYQLNMSVRIIVSGMRQLPPEVTSQLAEIAWRYRDKGVCAFDLAGPELGFSARDHRAAFGLVRQKLLNVSLHSGEAAPWPSIHHSVVDCGAQRIGHGVTLQQNPSLMQYIADRRIAVEVCLTSNIHTGAISQFDNHPVRKYFDAGILVVPCADNTTVSACDLVTEYTLLQNTFNFSPVEIVKIVDNGFRASFLDSTRKHRVRADVMHDCLRLLQAEGHDTAEITCNPYYRSHGLIPTSEKQFWGNWSNPPISSELIDLLPKVDLDCRLDGSASLKWFFSQYQKSTTLQANKRLADWLGSTFDTFEAAILGAKASNSREDDIKEVMLSLLQTRDQIGQALFDILSKAVEDNVKYMELAVRPSIHTRNGLTAHQVLEVAIDVKNRVESGGRITVGIVVYTDPAADGPLVVDHLARLAVELAPAGVVGFGFYGSDFPPESYQFYRTTFDYLREKRFNTTIFASTPAEIQAAVWNGANRISGAFKIDQAPRLADYCALHSINVEIGFSSLYQKETRKMDFAHPIRLMFDKNMKISVCSFHAALEKSRTASLLQMVGECHMTISELLRVVCDGLLHNFQSYQVRERMFREIWNETEKMLTARGFRYLHALPYHVKK